MMRLFDATWVVSQYDRSMGIELTRLVGLAWSEIILTFLSASDTVAAALVDENVVFLLTIYSNN
jgi:hypothetical protein